MLLKLDYKNSGKMDTWKEYQDDFNSYEKERERKKSLYQAVLKAKNWSVDHIPLPDMPMPDASGFRIGPQAPIGLPPKKENKKINKSPPGPPPGPPPGKKLKVLILTLTRPIGLPPHAPVAQKIADQR